MPVVILTFPTNIPPWHQQTLGARVHSHWHSDLLKVWSAMEPESGLHAVSLGCLAINCYVPIEWIPENQFGVHDYETRELVSQPLIDNHKFTAPHSPPSSFPLEHNKLGHNSGHSPSIFPLHLISICSCCSLASQK